MDFTYTNLNPDGVEIGDCAVRALSYATGARYIQVQSVISQWYARFQNNLDWLPAHGVEYGAIYRIMEGLGWTEVEPGESKRAYRRVAQFKPELLPASGVVVVNLKNHLTIVHDGMIRDTTDVGKQGRRRLLSYWVEHTDETANTYWDRADAYRQAKYGKVWTMVGWDERDPRNRLPRTAEIKVIAKNPYASESRFKQRYIQFKLLELTAPTKVYRAMQAGVTMETLIREHLAGRIAVEIESEQNSQIAVI